MNKKRRNAQKKHRKNVRRVKAKLKASRARAKTSPSA